MRSESFNGLTSENFCAAARKFVDEVAVVRRNGRDDQARLDAKLIGRALGMKNFMGPLLGMFSEFEDGRAFRPFQVEFTIAR